MTPIARLIAASRLFVSTWAKGPGILTAKAVVDAEAALAGIPEGEPTDPEVEALARWIVEQVFPTSPIHRENELEWTDLNARQRELIFKASRAVLRRERGLS